MWYRPPADLQLVAGKAKSHAVDQCCSLLSEEKSTGKTLLVGMLVIHVDDILIPGDSNSTCCVEAIKNLKKHFKYGKWDCGHFAATMDRTVTHHDDEAAMG